MSVDDRRREAASEIVRQAWPDIWTAKNRHLRPADPETSWQLRDANHRQFAEMVDACLADPANRSALVNRARRNGADVAEAVMDLVSTDELVR